MIETQYVNGDMHYEQCYMHEPCHSPGPHLMSIDGHTCWKCFRECICNRLVNMRNEVRDEYEQS